MGEKVMRKDESTRKQVDGLVGKEVDDQEKERIRAALKRAEERSKARESEVEND